MTINPRGFPDRARIAEGVVLALSTLACIGMYIVTSAPLYNPVGSIDPWLYTALWTNFDQVYHYFNGTYYVSRVPWIAPGYALNLVFDHRVAYFILHGLFFFVGAVLFYVFCRRWFGAIPAITAYVGLIGNQMYFNAHRWDYHVGGAFTFVIASVAFALPKTKAMGSRAISLGLAGLCSAAAVTTLIIDSAYLVVGLPLLYWAVSGDGSRRERLRQVVLDVAAYTAGAILLLMLGGIFAVTHGAEFFYFMPQVRAVFAIHGEVFQQPFHVWFPREPYIFLPIFATLLGCIVLLMGRPVSRLIRRLLIATIAWTAIVFGGVAVWEFGGTGYLFEYSFYFNVFLVPILFLLAAMIAAVLERPECQRLWPFVIVALVTLAVLAPGIWIYHSDREDRVADGLTHGPYLMILIAMVVALAFSILWRVRDNRLLAAGAATIAFFTVSYGADASLGTFTEGRSDPRTGAYYDLGSKMIAYLHRSGYAKKMPFFWYNDPYGLGQRRGLQSLYFYSYTYIGNQLPQINQDFRIRMSLYRPTKLVLLCSHIRCSGARTALARAGYPAVLARRHLLRDGPFRVWVEIYRLRKPLAQVTA